MKKVIFRGAEVNPILIENYLRFPPTSISEGMQFKNLMSEHDFEIACEITKERSLKTIAANFNILEKTWKSSDIYEEISFLTEQAFGSVDEKYLLLPLFFETDLKTPSLNYFSSEEMRQVVLIEYKKLLRNTGLTFKKTKADWIKFEFNKNYSFGTDDKFRRFSDKIGLSKIIEENDAALAQKNIAKLKIENLFTYIFIGLIFGPLGYIHANYDKVDVENGNGDYPEVKSVRILGVTISCSAYLILIILLVSFT